MRNFFPVLTVLVVLLGVWWAAVAPMNIRPALDVAERAGNEVIPEGSVTRRDVSVWTLMLNNRAHVATGLRDESTIFIRIQDEGHGIAKEYRELLFQPYFTTKDTGQGNIGLG